MPKNRQPKQREITLAEDPLEKYGVVVRMLGNCRLEVQDFDGETHNAHIRGSMRKRGWINVNDTVLIAIREFQKDKADVLIKYTPDEVRYLRSKGEIPDTIIKTDDNDLAVVFGEEEIDIDNI